MICSSSAGGVEPGRGVVATIGANLAHGVGHGPIGALVSAWPTLTLIGSFELPMRLIRTGRDRHSGEEHRLRQMTYFERRASQLRHLT